MAFERLIFRGIWHLVRNPKTQYVLCHDDPKTYYEPYKLHISIDKTVNVDPDVEKKLREMLDAAMLNGTIQNYKYLAPETRRISDFRNAHLPYVIYLHPKTNEENLKKLLSLCQEIQKLLTGIRAAPQDALTACDHVVSNNITFRQAARDGFIEYKGTEDKHYVSILAKQGFDSTYCKYLREHLSLKLLPSKRHSLLQ